MSSMMELERLKELVAEMERRRETSGVAKWFVPGSKMTTPSGFTHPAGIESYPKHKLFFELGKANRERVLLCGNRCLAEGTLVATPEGPRPIETLKIGDMVYNRYKQPTRVIGVYDNGEAPTVSLRNRGKEYLRCTPDHEILCNTTDGQRICGVYEIDTDVVPVVDEHSSQFELACPEIARVFDITVDDPEHLYLLANGLCVANCGKSIAGAFETACHLTGLYPDWWTGRRFDKPVKFWVAGKDKTTTRDTLQKELFGSINAFGTGMIPAEMIDRTWSMQGVPAGIELANIKHVSGGLSQVGFKSYDRGVDSFFGTAMDGIWLDEECPEDVYGECLLRTMTTNGLLYLTFTPKKGLTPLVLGLAKASKFIDSDRFIEMEEGLENPSRVVVMGSWDDVPHLDEKSKQEILQGTPPALRDAVSKGIPTIGEGTVFPLSRSDIEVEDFPVPPHWKRWYGMDVGGWTACTFMAENPDTGQLYVTGVYKRDRAEPLIHAQGIKNLAKNWMMGAIDPASRQRSQVDGQQLMVMYRNMGLNIVPANNAVDAGISQMWELLSTGKMKVFKSCTPLFSEMMVYRYENGRVKKENDHIMDSWRYAVMTRDKVSRTPPPQNTNLQGYSHGRTFNF